MDIASGLFVGAVKFEAGQKCDAVSIRDLEERGTMRIVPGANQQGILLFPSRCSEVTTRFE